MLSCFNYISCCFETPKLYSNSVVPNKDESYYINQANTYFSFLETTSKDHIEPNYSPSLIRWEWEPWLILTGLNDERTLIIDSLIRETGKCECLDRELVFYNTNPFVRCRVTFYYGENKTPIKIYEEFTFDGSGNISFIEAWYDVEDNKLQIPEREFDGWPKFCSVKRLSNLIPGYNKTDFILVLESSEMISQAELYDDVKNFKSRAEKFAVSLFAELVEQIIDSRRDKNIPY